MKSWTIEVAPGKDPASMTLWVLPARTGHTVPTPERWRYAEAVQEFVETTFKVRNTRVVAHGLSDDGYRLYEVVSGGEQQ